MTLIRGYYMQKRWVDMSGLRLLLVNYVLSGEMWDIKC